MKVVSSKQMAYIESLAYRDGASEEDFMEEAGSGVALFVNDFAERNQVDRRVILLCGKGNNAGDAYVTGIHLLHLEYEVFALQLAPILECSPLCQENYHRFLREGGRVREVSSMEDVFFPPMGIIVDGIFGTGFHGKAEELFASVISAANKSRLPIIAIDIPSGLNGETGAAEGDAIIATETTFLGLPKTGFFLRDGWNHVGRLRYVDFGLPNEYIEESEADMVMLKSDIMEPLLPVIVRNRHKYQAGYVVGLAGSPGMSGAAIMSSISALKGGAGIVRLLHPLEMKGELVASPFELIKTPYEPNDINTIIEQLNKASAVFLGPGMGRTKESKKLLKGVLPNIVKPCVLDADALFILAEEDIPLPPQTVMTPHFGEMQRMLGSEHTSLIDSNYLQACQEYAETKKITLILKGGPTYIFHPGEPISVNPVSDPGMATAGAGDILTGLIAALLAQGLSTHHAAQLGVYIHGIAGEHAAMELTSYCMTATDILFYFPEGFRLIEL